MFLKVQCAYQSILKNKYYISPKSTFEYKQNNQQEYINLKADLEKELPFHSFCSRLTTTTAASQIKECQDAWFHLSNSNNTALVPYRSSNGNNDTVLSVSEPSSSASDDAIDFGPVSGPRTSNAAAPGTATGMIHRQEEAMICSTDKLLPRKNIKRKGGEGGGEKKKIARLHLRDQKKNVDAII